MRIVTNYLALLMFANVVGTVCSAEIAPVFTEPDCSNKPYIVAVTDSNGSPLPYPPGGLYCNENDFDAWDFSKSNYAAKIDELIGGEQVQNIYLANYFYSDISFANWLCDISDAAVNIYLYYQSSGSTYDHISKDFADSLGRCDGTVVFREIGCDIFEEQNRCGGGANILHAKVSLFEMSNGELVVFSGSGNANKSFYANLEDWQIWRTSHREGVGIRIRCLFDVLEEISGLRIVPIGFFERVNKQCLSSRNLELSERTPNIKIATLPSDSDWYRQEIIRAINSADRVLVTSQFLDDPEIVGAILEKIGSVTMVMDDDWYWALKGITSSEIIGQSDVANFETAFLNGDLNISFLLTNHHSEARLKNTNHLRYLVTQSAGGAPVVFTGGAHLKEGSINLNIEIQYVLSDPETVSGYLEHFSRLEARSLKADQMPIFDAPAN